MAGTGVLDAGAAPGRSLTAVRNPLLFHLLDGVQRFDELRRGLLGVTQRMLTKQLRELDAAGLVQRTIYAEVPPRVEYRLTEPGLSLRPIVLAMRECGLEYLQAQRA